MVRIIIENDIKRFFIVVHIHYILIVGKIEDIIMSGYGILPGGG